MCRRSRPTEPAPGTAAPGPAQATGGGPSLGITVDELTDEARASYGLTVRRGASITHVRAGTPADRAGLPVGGVVVTLDGRRIDSANDLVAAISAAQPGQEIELGYYEGNRFGRKSIKLAPSTAAAAPGSVPRHERRNAARAVDARPGRTDESITSLAAV